MELLIIRHALPERVEVEDGSAADPGLDELGWKQAQALAEWLVDEHIDALYTSPLRRARETAEPVAKVTGLAPIVEEGVAEFDRGMSFYIPVEELKRLKDDRWYDVIEGRWGPAADMTPQKLQGIVVEAMERIITANPSRKVAVICHGGVTNLYLASILGLANPMFFEPAYTNISRVMASREGHRYIRSMNETAHVRGLLPPPAFG